MFKQLVPDARTRICAVPKHIPVDNGAGTADEECEPGGNQHHGAVRFAVQLAGVGVAAEMVRNKRGDQHQPRVVLGGGAQATRHARQHIRAPCLLSRHRVYIEQARRGPQRECDKERGRHVYREKVGMNDGKRRNRIQQRGPHSHAAAK